MKKIVKYISEFLIIIFEMNFEVIYAKIIMDKIPPKYPKFQYKSPIKLEPAGIPEYLLITKVLEAELNISLNTPPRGNIDGKDFIKVNPDSNLNTWGT